MPKNQHFNICANPAHLALYGQAVKLRRTFTIHQDTIKDLSATLRVITEKITQEENNIAVLTRQLREITGTVITIIRSELDLCIFCENKKYKIRNQIINTDKNLVPINKVIPYQNLEDLRLLFSVNEQDPYFFVREKLPLEIVIH
jgi:hypothetical protein